jgi:hypothetical protein
MVWVNAIRLKAGSGSPKGRKPGLGNGDWNLSLSSCSQVADFCHSGCLGRGP